MADVPSFHGTDEYQLLLSLEHDSDLIAVLRGHLYVEATLDKVIAKHYPGADEVVLELTYMSKIRLARRRGLIDKAMATALQRLGNVRDSFAHLPIKAHLTDDDDATLRSAMRGAALERAFSRYISEDRSVRTGVATRNAILAMFTVLWAHTVSLEQIEAFPKPQ